MESWGPTMPYDAPPELSGLSLEDIAALVAARKLPPVKSWNPGKTGESDMRIAADGRWYHQGGEITRIAIIRAFSSLLRRESDGSYSLVTPQERLRIDVEDAPFQAIELRSEGDCQNRTMAFRLNSDDLVIAGSGHEIEMRAGLPYLHVRDGLWAKISRAVFYEMAVIALRENSATPCIWSGGIAFSLGEMA
jgi:uncharacterized protein